MFKGMILKKVSTSIVDVDKPRDTADIKNTTVPFEMGNILRVNNVTGIAKVRETIALYAQFGMFRNSNWRSKSIFIYFN